jgi:hypothetical protein
MVQDFDRSCMAACLGTDGLFHHEARGDLDMSGQLMFLHFEDVGQPTESTEINMNHKKTWNLIVSCYTTVESTGIRLVAHDLINWKR